MGSFTGNRKADSKSTIVNTPAYTKTQNIQYRNIDAVIDASGSIEMVRLYKRNKGRFPALGYSEYANFFNAIFKADYSRVVLVKKE